MYVHSYKTYNLGQYLSSKHIKLASKLKPMKKTKRKIYKASNFLIGGLMSLLGFSPSCIFMTEYGTPSADFILRGTVRSAETGEAIEHIQTIANEDTFYTDRQGKFNFYYSLFGAESGSVVMRFRDIDSIEHGEYEPLDTIIFYNSSQFEGGDSWDEGTLNLDLDIDLKSK